MSAPPLSAAGERARVAARSRLLNTLLREVGPPPVPDAQEVRLEVPGRGLVVVAGIVQYSAAGHHRWSPDVAVEDADGTRHDADHHEVLDLLLEVAAAASPDGPDAAAGAALAAHVRDSERRTEHYLAAPPRPVPSDPHGWTRHVEQAVRHGHPFHPLAKCLDAPGAQAMEPYAPELGHAFVLHHLAVDPAIAAGSDGDGEPWVPGEVAARAPRGWPVLPVHPWQRRWLDRGPVAALLAGGSVIDLGPGGDEVYPTSSVRTVCDPSFPTAWKLPLHVRITNFVRTNPTEHALRSAHASDTVRALRPRWRHPGFGVLVERGWRGLDPAAVGEDTAADVTVLFRENPFAGDGSVAPGTLAGLVEAGPYGEEPLLVRAARDLDDPEEWLRAFLAVSLLPLLTIFARDGVGFEAHLQNTLLATDGGRPTHFWVRDMEGTHVSRDRRPAGLEADSPLVYDEGEAWLRLRYHAVVNQLASVVAVLGHHLGGRATEEALWRVVATTLSDLPDEHAAAAPYAHDLLSTPTLPAKANLLTRLGSRSADALFVELANPIAAAAR